MSEKLFYENEISTNKLASRVLIIVGTMICAVGVMGKLEQADNPYGEFSLVLIALGACVDFICAYIWNHNDRKCCKHIVVTMLILIFGFLTFMYPLSTTFLTFGPILVSLKYYDNKFTINTSVATLIVFVADILLGFYFYENTQIVKGMYDYQGVDLFKYSDYTWLYYVIPRASIIVVTAILGISISEGGKRLIARQSEITEKASRMKSELETAAKIQRQNMPAFEYVTEDESVELHAFIEPAREVGGDIFDYFMVNKHILTVVMADVSDKGIASSRYGTRLISSCRYAFRELADSAADFEIEDIDLGHIAKTLNRTLCGRNDANYFATTCIMCVDCNNGKIRYINAGHEMPIVRRVDGKAEEVRNESQRPFGLFDSSEYQVESLCLQAGELVFMYTDGLTDAVSESGERYGMKRAMASLNSIACDDNNKTLSLDLINMMTEEIYSYIGSADQYDDITMLAFTYRG